MEEAILHENENNSKSCQNISKSEFYGKSKKELIKNNSEEITKILLDIYNNSNLSDINQEDNIIKDFIERNNRKNLFNFKLFLNKNFSCYYDSF